MSARCDLLLCRTCSEYFFFQILASLLPLASSLLVLTSSSAYHLAAPPESSSSSLFQLAGLSLGHELGFVASLCFEAMVGHHSTLPL